MIFHVDSFSEVSLLTHGNFNALSNFGCGAIPKEILNQIINFFDSFIRYVNDIKNIYIIGANTKLLSTVIFPLSDKFRCFHIFSVAFSVNIFKVGHIIICYHNTKGFYSCFYP